jgi:hypothetical protein
MSTASVAATAPSRMPLTLQFWLFVSPLERATCCAPVSLWSCPSLFSLGKLLCLSMLPLLLVMNRLLFLLLRQRLSPYNHYRGLF